MFSPFLKAADALVCVCREQIVVTLVAWNDESAVHQRVTTGGDRRMS